MKVFFGAFAVDLLAGAIIQSGAGGDKTKETARAQEVFNVVTGLQEILNGDVTTGINAVAAALQASTVLSPAETMAVNNLIMVAGNQAQLLSNVGAATILGQANAAIVGNALSEVLAVCVKYGAVAASTTAPTPAAAVA